MEDVHIFRQILEDSHSRFTCGVIVVIGYIHDGGLEVGRLGKRLVERARGWRIGQEVGGLGKRLVDIDQEVVRYRARGWWIGQEVGGLRKRLVDIGQEVGGLGKRLLDIGQEVGGYRARGWWIGQEVGGLGSRLEDRAGGWRRDDTKEEAPLCPGNK